MVLAPHFFERIAIIGQLDHAVATIALTMGAAWASGINLYAAILVLGLMGASGNIVLPSDLQVLATPLVIAAAGVMYCIEFVADKIPGIDNGWDTIHTFIRIPAGALLAAGAVGYSVASIACSGKSRPRVRRQATATRMINPFEQRSIK